MLHIIDDEEVIRDSLAWLAESHHISAQTYASGTLFLERVSPSAEGDCILLDVRMPDINGVALFETLAARRLTARMPVIFLTGHGDVPMAVDVLKRGAFDFFEKPFDDEKLLARVHEALAASRAAAANNAVQERVTTLSPREREVLDLILLGKMNKVIADELGISMRTVEVHRAHIFDKMQVKTAVELAGLLK